MIGVWTPPKPGGRPICRVVAVQGRRWQVPGPNKKDEDCGRINLNKLHDRDALRHQGRLLTGNTTTAFCNLVSNHFCHLGVGSSEAEFVPDLKTKLDLHGRTHFWAEYLSHLAQLECGSSKLDWKSSKVINLQVFWGPLEAGHFASLILDRTRHFDPLAVYADSLPGYHPGAMAELQQMLGCIEELGTNKMTWIEASVPRQGMGTNDCGVFSSCFSFLYLHALQQGGLLSDAPVNPDKSVTGVTLFLPPKMDATQFGAHGRGFMNQSMKRAKIDWQSPVLRAKVRFT